MFGIEVEDVVVGFGNAELPSIPEKYSYLSSMDLCWTSKSSPKKYWKLSPAGSVDQAFRNIKPGLYYLTWLQCFEHKNYQKMLFHLYPLSHRNLHLEKI